jgi:patatin-like phospholipase/acyl hydrolase
MAIRRMRGLWLAAVDILCIDGGGIRGIIPAMVLAELEARSGRPIAELFDLIAGTSTGGILAAALTAPSDTGAGPRHTAAELVDLYRTEGPKIFARSLWQRIHSAEGLLDEKHDDAALRDALHRYLGDTRLAEARTRLLVTAYELETRTAYFFKSWRTDEPGRDFRLADVARAAAAAPTYFEPLRGTARDGAATLALVDGGVFATNPAMCAFAEAHRLEHRGAVRLVSLGTGEHMKPIHFEDARGWGLIEWVRPVIDVVFDGVADTVDYQLGQLVLDGDYLRLQTELDRASDALDDASAHNLAALEEQARELIAARSTDLDRVVRLLQNRR